jgi:ribosome-associated protein
LEGIDIARKAVDVASDKQASEIVLLDVQGVCSFTDYFVIATGESTRQLRTILDETRKALKEAGVLPHHEEGGTDTGWMLLDYGDVVIHLFGPDERAYYDLDGLWREGTTVLTIQ